MPTTILQNIKPSTFILREENDPENYQSVGLFFKSVQGF